MHVRLLPEGDWPLLLVVLFLALNVSPTSAFDNTETKRRFHVFDCDNWDLDKMISEAVQMIQDTQKALDDVTTLKATPGTKLGHQVRNAASMFDINYRNFILAGRADSTSRADLTEVRSKSD
jgi:hypothetical protein